MAAVLFLQNISSANAVCMLCEDGVAGLQFPYAVVKSDGTTCTELAIDFAMDYTEGSGSCIENIQAWRQICCGDEQPIDVDVTDVFDNYPDIDSIETIGEYGKCDVCRDGDYPSASSMVINLLYVGQASCPQYWKAGQQGLIPNHLCAPLQYFAYEPCGCGEYSTNGNYDWDDSSSSGGSVSSGSASGSNSGSSNTNDDDSWWSAADSSGNNDDGGSWWNGGGSSLPTASDTDDAAWWGNADSSAATKRSSAVLAVLAASTAFFILYT